MEKELINPASLMVTWDEFTKYGDVSYEEWLILYAQEHAATLISTEALSEHPCCRNGHCE